MKKTILSKILWPIIYMTLAIGLCISVTVVVFKNNYYENVFVEGGSMYPTLKKGEVGVVDGTDYGVTDNRTITKKKLKRFDIVTTYYPFSSEDYDFTYEYVKGESKLKDSAYYKIKRLIALPGETFKIDFNELYILENDNWIHIEFPFERALQENNYRDVKETTLKEDEYWVMGDNWYIGQSRDSANQFGDKYNGPVYYENLIGKLISIDGVCTLVNENGKLKCINRHPHKKIYF